MTTTLSNTIRGHHHWNNQKSHLGSVASFVPKQGLAYKLVDLVHLLFSKNKPGTFLQLLASPDIAETLTKLKSKFLQLLVVAFKNYVLMTSM